MKGARAGAALTLLAAAVTACIREYHPEYRPETSYRVVQNVSYPTTIVNVAQAPAPPPVLEERRPVARAPRAADGPVASPWAPPEPRPPARDEPPPVVATGDPPAPRPVVERAPPSLPGPDLDEARARCRAGDPSGCRALPGIHLSGNVVIHGNVTMFGDVYMNDAVALSSSPAGG